MGAPTTQCLWTSHDDAQTLLLDENSVPGNGPLLLHLSKTCVLRHLACFSETSIRISILQVEKLRPGEGKPPSPLQFKSRPHSLLSPGTEGCTCRQAVRQCLAGSFRITSNRPPSSPSQAHAGPRTPCRHISGQCLRREVPHYTRG